MDDNTISRRNFLEQMLAAGGLATLAGAVGCKDKYVTPENAVIRKKNPYPQMTEVTPANYDKIVKLGVPTFIMFTSPRCGFCNPVDPAYEKVAKQYYNTDVFFAKCDLSKPENSAIGQKLVGGVAPRMAFVYGSPRYVIDGKMLGENVSDQPEEKRADAMKALIERYVSSVNGHRTK